LPEQVRCEVNTGGGDSDQKNGAQKYSCSTDPFAFVRGRGVTARFGREPLHPWRACSGSNDAPGTFVGCSEPSRLRQPYAAVSTKIVQWLDLRAASATNHQQSLLASSFVKLANTERTCQLSAEH